MISNRIPILFCFTVLVLGTQAEPLRVTFGAAEDLSATYDGQDLGGLVRQDHDPAAPGITIEGLDLDGIGEHDDRIELRFTVKATGGELARLAAGYRLDPGYALSFDISSTAVVLGPGATRPAPRLTGSFVSVTGNNRAAPFTVSDTTAGFVPRTDQRGTVLFGRLPRFTIQSTTAANNRARRITVELELPVDLSLTLAAPVVPPVAGKRIRHPRPAPSPALPALPAIPIVPKRNPTSLSLPRLFCDHMILQQQLKNTIWGWADPGDPVAVSASWGASVSTQADAGGRWKVLLDTPGPGTGHSLTIRGKETIHLQDVAIGEVWLCAGQSNMGWSLGNTFGGEEEAARADYPDFRIFKSSREHWHQPLDRPRDRLSHWAPCNPETAAATSAVSYYFGKKLHRELGIPVGIIQQAYAGTPIEGWMPWEVQQHHPRSQFHKAELDTTTARQTGSMGQSTEQALADFETELATYEARIDAGEMMKNSVKPLSPPIITKPARLGHQYPAHQFNAMIHPVRPYGIRGAIWYQGERNSKNVPQAYAYREQLALLVNYYRSSWHAQSGGYVADDFRFQFTQLPSWTPAQDKPVEGLKAPWAVNRESMRLATRDLPNTGIAVAIDTGDATALHPKNKQPIGLRHAYLALQQTYGRDIVGQGPRYQKHRIKGNQIVLEFDSIGSGMVPARAGQLNAFAIAGADQVWYWAEADIAGDTVVVSSPQVANPVAVRYAWAMNPSQRNLLYNQEGFPASPFRTDDWPLFDPAADIVTVLKPAKPTDKTSVDWERPAMTQ